eukprot:gene8053-22142_t
MGCRYRRRWVQQPTRELFEYCTVETLRCMGPRCSGNRITVHLREPHWDVQVAVPDDLHVTMTFAWGVPMGLLLAGGRPVLRAVLAGTHAAQCVGINDCIGKQLMRVGRNEVTDRDHAIRLVRNVSERPPRHATPTCSLELVFSLADDSPCNLAELLAQRSDSQTMGVDDPTNGRQCARCAPEAELPAAIPHRPFQRIYRFWHAPQHLLVQIMRFRRNGTKMLAPVRLPTVPFRVPFLSDVAAAEPATYWYR